MVLLVLIRASGQDKRCFLEGSYFLCFIFFCDDFYWIGRAEESNFFFGLLLCRITECFGLEGKVKLVLYQPSVMGRSTFHHTRFLQASSNLILNTSREGDLEASD